MNKKKAKINKKLYDIIPSQNSMYLMYKFGLHKQQAQIPTSFTVKTKLDFNILQRAFNIEIERNDSLRLRFIKENGTIKQYFGDKYDYKVPVKYFFSLNEQNEFFEKDAPEVVHFMKDETFRIYFFRTAHKGTGIYTNFSHMIMDAMGIVIFYLDLLSVYNALVNKTELPEPLYKYEDYVVKELERVSDTKKMEKHEAFYKEYFLKGGEPFYAGVHGPELLEKFRKKKKNPDARVPMAYNPLHDKCDMAVYDISKEYTERIISYCQKTDISPESIFQAGLRTYCSAINYRTDDVCMMTVCNKRVTYKEKKMSGCLAQPLILRTIIPENTSFRDAVEILKDTRTNLYRHTAYPYTLARDLFLKLFDFGPIQGANNMMFSWIPVPVDMEFPFEIEFRTYNLERYFTPLYTMVIPDAVTKGIKVYYMYRTKLSTAAQIERLHKESLKIILDGIENPDTEISVLMDKVSPEA